MGTVARRRFISPPLRHTAAHRGSLDQTRAGRSFRSPRFAGARAMIGFLDQLVRPLLYALDPEDAHRLAIRMLQIAPLPPAGLDDSRLATRVFGLNFPNPIGIAAGFDKHAEIPDALLRTGFGFVEAGTVTPLPQPGNPRPRLFRLDADQAVINRLGFNSEGADAVLRRLAARAKAGGIVGINVGANKDAPNRVDGMIVGNITGTRPSGLRDAQSAEAGGLSGHPLLLLADRMLAETYVRVEGVFPLVGAGGIDSGVSALGKIRAGASLIQIYSGLVFRGLRLVREIKATMLAALERDGSQIIADYVGSDAAAVT